MTLKNKDKLYNIKIENDKTKKIYDSGFKPCNHKDACILMSKMNHSHPRRIFLEENVK